MSLRSSRVRHVWRLLALAPFALFIRPLFPEEPRSLVAEALASPPGVLATAEQERRVLAGKVRAAVDAALASARRLMAENPRVAEQDLKLILDRLDQTPELDAELKSQLRQPVIAAIRQSQAQKVAADQRVAEAQESQAAAKDVERLSDQLAGDQQRMKQLVDRFHSLLDERRFDVATEQITPEVERLAPGSTIESSVAVSGGFTSAAQAGDDVRRTRDHQFVRALASAERSAVPFSDDKPIVYLPAEQRRDITLGRDKYKSVDLHQPGSSEQKIFSELNQPTTLEVVEMPLKDVLLYFSETHGIPIVLSSKKLDEASISPDTPVTKTLRGVTLRSALRLILKDLELSYLVQDEVVQITTPEDAAAQLSHKVYPVGDLVVPIRPPTNILGLGGMGGMNGGPGLGNPLGGQMNGSGANMPMPGINMPGAGQNPGVNIF